MNAPSSYAAAGIVDLSSDELDFVDGAGGTTRAALRFIGGMAARGLAGGVGVAVGAAAVSAAALGVDYLIDGEMDLLN